MELKPKRMSFSIKRKPEPSRNSNRKIISSNSSLLHQTILPPSPIKKKPSLGGNQMLISRAHSSTFTSVSSTCWCLFDAKTSTELGFRQSYKRQVASLTKIMTTIVGLELKARFKLNSNLLIKVTEGASKNIGTTAHLKTDYWICLKDLFYGIMLPSGNDAAHLLAQVIGFMIYQCKKIEEQLTFQDLKQIDLTGENTSLLMAQFIRAMNLKAEQLELEQTRFSNPHGLQNAFNTSTAKDMLVLGMYASEDKTFREIMNTDVHRCFSYSSDKKKKELKVWNNTNMLLKDGWEGMKTGQTTAAGNCLASVKNEVYIVVLNCPDSMSRFNETKRLYEWYINRKKVMNPTESTTSTDSFQL